MMKSLKSLPALSCAAMLMAASAHAETSVSALANVEAGYGSNPFLHSGSNQETGTLSGSLTPTVTVTSPTSETNLFGTVEHVIFTRSLGDITNWSLGGNSKISLSPRSSFGINGRYSNRVYSALGTALDSTLPTEIDEQPLPDPSATEIAGRRVKQLSGGASFNSSLSARDTLTLSGSVSDIDYDTGGTSGTDYTTYGGSLGVMHALNARVSLGASVGYTRADYDTAGFGSVEQITPSANARILLSPTWTLSVSGGASFSRVIGAAGVPRRTYFSGSASLCHSGVRSDLCALVSRSLGSTALSGGSTITSAGLTYGYKLTPRSSIRLAGRFSEAKSIYPGGTANNAYVSTSASYNQDLTERLSLVVTARYTDPYRSASTRRKSYYGGVGLTYRLGR